jgi:hypothetical protein
LIGDSHSKHWVPGLHNLFSKYDVSAINLGRGGVLPFTGGSTYDNPDSNVPMLDRNDEIHDYLEKIRPKVVIISARWALYADTASSYDADEDVRYFTYGQHAKPDSTTSLMAMEQALIDTISRYRSLGMHTVLIGQVPPLGGSIKDCLIRPGYLATSKSVDNCRVYSKKDALSRIQSTDELLVSMKDRFGPSVTVFMPSEWLCKSIGYCDLFSDSGILYKDGDHLSYHGSIAVVKSHSGLFENFMPESVR